MRKLFSSLILFFVAASAFSQIASIKGFVIDSVDKKNLNNTAITLLQKSDSILVKFTRAGKEGSFLLSGLKGGSYILMNTHPYMGDYFNNIELKNDEALDLGNIFMTPKSKLLAEVILKSGTPIRIKGDTTIYTADSFKVRPGANVEELLRRLPGISVDKDGKITAMGERVKKVLVDGEEFFGTDPGIATKNLRADAVQEVQVFDKKSDQAEFTGIDDWVKDKTINLKMKKQAGFFGKFEAGGGLKDKYNNSAMLNLFRNKQKLAGYGIISNTGQTNLDWQDAQNYGGGSDNMMSGTTDDGGMFISFNNDDGFRNGQGGIPKNWNGGLHFSDKFNGGKNSFNSGYKYSKINAPGITNTFSQTFLPDTSWSSNSRSDNYTSTIKHAFILTIDFNLDSFNSLKWASKYNNNTGRTDNKFYSETIDDQAQFINNSTRNSTNNSDKNNVASSLLWRHKFKKLSRTLSVNTDYNWSQSMSDGLLYSLNNYYLNGSLSHRDTTDQQNIIDNNNNSISTKIAYTEPLRKDFYLELSYGFSYNNSKSDRITNFKSFNGKYEEEIDSLSNSFIFNRTANSPGLNFRLNKKKYSFSFGSTVAFTHFEQKNLSVNTVTNYSYTNFLPRISYNYKIKPNENIRISYNGANNAPTPEQLQPTRVNTDPLNVYIGNPVLKQSFRHSINGSYNFYNVLKEKNLWTSLSFNTTQNAFVNSSIIDNVGKRIYQTVNADGMYGINFYGNYGMKIKDTKWQFGFGPEIYSNRRIDFINNVKNSTVSSSYVLNINLNQYVPEKYNFYISTGFGWNHAKGTVNKSANADYWSVNGNASGRVTLAKKIDLGSNISTQFRQKDPRFSNRTNFTNWNANIAKRFMKDDKLEIKFEVMDLLNQNRGYDRNFDSYSFTETYYNTLKRFWLLSATWNISKNGKPAKSFF